MKFKIKTLKLLGLVTFITLILPSSFSQTYYSTFNTPVSGTNYWYSTSGVCLGCAITNPSNSVSMSKADSTKISVVAGVLNGATIRMKLTDSANTTASIVVKDNNGNMSLANVTIKTYLNGSFKQSFSGSSSINSSNLSGSKKELSVAATQTYNEVEISFNGFLSIAWDMYVYYAKGVYIAPLPLRIFNMNGKYLQSNLIKFSGRYSVDEPLISLSIYAINSMANEIEVGKMEIPNTNINSIQYFEWDYDATSFNPERFYILLQYADGTYEKSEIASIENDFIKLNTLSVFPNPSKDFIYINSEINTRSEIEIMNVYGEKLFTQVIEPGNNKVDVSQLSAGIYYINYKNAKLPEPFKLIVN